MWNGFNFPTFPPVGSYPPQYPYAPGFYYPGVAGPFYDAVQNSSFQPSFPYPPPPRPLAISLDLPPGPPTAMGIPGWTILLTYAQHGGNQLIPEARINFPTVLGVSLKLISDFYNPPSQGRPQHPSLSTLVSPEIARDYTFTEPSTTIQPQAFDRSAFASEKDKFFLTEASLRPTGPRRSTEDVKPLPQPQPLVAVQAPPARHPAHAPAPNQGSPQAKPAPTQPSDPPMLRIQDFASFAKAKRREALRATCVSRKQIRKRRLRCRRFKLFRLTENPLDVCLRGFRVAEMPRVSYMTRKVVLGEPIKSKLGDKVSELVISHMEELQQKQMVRTAEGLRKNWNRIEPLNMHVLIKKQMEPGRRENSVCIVKKMDFSLLILSAVSAK